MRGVSMSIVPFASMMFISRPITRGQEQHPLLEELYDDFNGGFFWGRSLLVRPLQPTEGAPLSVAEWNMDGLWKNLYDGRCRGVTFFAEDAFGIQFGVCEEGVLHLDLETASMTKVADTLEEWCEAILREPEFYTGAPVLDAWERTHGSIRMGHRLVPRQLFTLGGEFHSSNMICMADVAGLRVRAEFWALTKDLPDGQKVEFRVVEED